MTRARPSLYFKLETSKMPPVKQQLKSVGCIMPMEHSWGKAKHGYQTCLWCQQRRKAKKP